MSTIKNWHEDVFFGLHYDLHASASDTELGKNLTEEHLRERLLRIKPDWIQCDCKGHRGYTSWPTEVGSTSPGVVKDALRIHRTVTTELGIKLGMHYSGVIDERAIELHPNWSAISSENKPFENGTTCRLSPYVDELMIPQMLELVQKYDIDGFWVDGDNWGATPCWCLRCQEEFEKRSGIPKQNIPRKAGDPHWFEWLAFHRDLFTEYVTKYANAVHALKPDCMVCSNWMYTIRQPDPITAPIDYLSGDYTPNWGASRAAIEARMLDSRGQTWDLMVWGFTRNYTFPKFPWSMKNALHLSQEVSEVIALGGAVMIYSTPQRSGLLCGWQHDIMAEVARFCRERKRFCFKSQSASETAVLHLASHYYKNNEPLFNYGNAIQPLEGAINILTETQRSVDILTEEKVGGNLGKYKLLVVPEQTNLSDNVKKSLKTFVEQGGFVLMSGAHLVEEVSELVGCAPGKVLEGAQIPISGECAVFAGDWQAPLLSKAEALRFCCCDLEPLKINANEPVVTFNRIGRGGVVAIHGSFFENYFVIHFPRIRRLFDEIVGALPIDWNVELSSSRRLEMICRKKEGNLLVNLINRGSGETLSPERTIIEELPPVTNVLLKIKCSSSPKSITLQPEGHCLNFIYIKGHAELRIPEVRIHDIVKICF